MGKLLRRLGVLVGFELFLCFLVWNGKEILRGFVK